jgi:hypothetical protein
MLGMDPRSDIGDEVSDDDLAEINAQLALADPLDAVPFVPVVYGDFAAMEREFEEQLAEDTAHADNFVPAPGRIRCDCGWKLGEQASRALLSHIAAAAALAGSKQAEPTSSSHSRDGQPPQQHAGPGGHATPHLALTPRLQDQDPARA